MLGFCRAGRPLLSKEERSVSPVEKEGSEREDEVGRSGGNAEDGSFDRMMEPFGQDKEEQEWEETFGQGSKEGDRAKVVTPPPPKR